MFMLQQEAKNVKKIAPLGIRNLRRRAIDVLDI